MILNLEGPLSPEGCAEYSAEGGHPGMIECKVQEMKVEYVAQQMS